MLTRFKTLVGRSLRYKLLLLVLLPILLMAPLLLGVAAYWSYRFTDEELFRRVNTDLVVADDSFQRIQRRHLADLRYLADSHAFREYLRAGNTRALERQVQDLQQQAGFDFLYLIRSDGRHLLTAPSTRIGSKPSPLLDKAVNHGTPAVGVEVYSRAQLESESPVLAARASLALVDAHGTAIGGTEDQAIVIRAVHPLKDRGGRTVALLDGGVLLNRNFSFVDAIRDLVYGPGSVPESGWGAVTVFLGDVRVSTNVPHSFKDGERALGTRAPKEAYRRVVQGGDKWTDRTYVVNDWYISAYMPIVDAAGTRVGMLNTEFLESPFRSAHRQTLAVLVMALALTALGASAVAVRGAKSIFRPIEAMTAVVRAEQAGEERRIGPLNSRDEIGELARQFDKMLDLLERRNGEIRQAADQLERKVEERTQQLTQQNVRLQNSIDLLRKTRQQLVNAEKFAALGQLTAGMAHEINNPTAVILGNMDVIIGELGEKAGPVETEVNLIIEQVYRIRSIVNKLLQYSRTSRHVGALESVDVNRAVDDTLVLVKHELAAKSIVVQKRLAARRPVRIDRQELQQVLVNLLLNAIHAVSEGGEVQLLTRDWADKGAVISVKDFGTGIPAEQLARVFDPFYTTREKGGTGLGLSISYSLIRRYGGQITVKSVEGRWTRFDVLLREEPTLADDEAALIREYLNVS